MYTLLLQNISEKMIYSNKFFFGMQNKGPVRKNDLFKQIFFWYVK